MHLRPRALAVLATCAALAVAGCGTRTDAPDPSDPEAAGEWQVEHLAGEPAVDFSPVLATDGDDALVLMLSDEGVLQTHLSLDGGPFVAGEPLATGIRYAALAGAVRLPDGDWFALGSGGLEEAGDDEELRFAPFGLRSSDGLAWDVVEVSGFSGPVDLNALVAVENGVVAVGSHRTARDPSMGGFRAAAWFSADGLHFEELALPGADGGESYAGHLVAADGRLLAAGRVAREAALWHSEDAGRTWQRSDDPLVRDAYALSGLAADGETVLASLAEDAAHLLRSTDGGRTWSRVDAPGPQGEGWTPVWAAGGRFLTLGGLGAVDPWESPEACYADLDQCGYADPDIALYASEDGAQWRRVDTGDSREPDRVAGPADGRTLLLTGERRGLAVRTWPAGAYLPTDSEPAGPRTVELVTLEEGASPEVGVRYHAPMYVHCGMDWFWFGDDTWRRTDDGPGLETGAGDEPDQEWPVKDQMIFGFATVDAGGVLEYSIGDGQVIASYERAAGAPGCD